MCQVVLGTGPTVIRQIRSCLKNLRSSGRESHKQKQKIIAGSEINAMKKIKQCSDKMMGEGAVLDSVVRKAPLRKRPE